ncbi:ABC transporter permease [Citrobacter sp. S-77]|uniref:ABC transporter permease n=1 Tax=Citrobacter sp. S-77 TaxID=1080067 RepID=UPI0008FFA0ED|nr:ABC transporter permease [Citrobacter sp. S-77]
MSLVNGFISDVNRRATIYEVWQSRHLIVQLIIRDLSVRYSQTLLGWLWAFLNPAMNMAMYYAIFGVMVRFSPPEYQVSYSWVLLCGLILWMLFASTLNAVSESLINNIQLVKKVYFPRVALTFSCIGVNSIDFLITMFWLICLLPFLGTDWSVYQLPLLFICSGVMVLTGWGVGCLMAILRTRFRDFRHIIPLLTQCLFYATPVVWTPGLLPERFYFLTVLNPLSGIISLFRYVLLGGACPSFILLIISFSGCGLIILAGYFCFNHYEALIVDRE